MVASTLYATPVGAERLIIAKYVFERCLATNSDPIKGMARDCLEYILVDYR